MQAIKEWATAIPIFILFVIGYVALAEFGQFMLGVSLMVGVPCYIVYWSYNAWRKRGD